MWPREGGSEGSGALSTVAVIESVLSDRMAVEGDAGLGEVAADAGRLALIPSPNPEEPARALRLLTRDGIEGRTLSGGGGGGGDEVNCLSVLKTESYGWGTVGGLAMPDNLEVAAAGDEFCSV